jgi:hypothetical protein
MICPHRGMRKIDLLPRSDLVYAGVAHPWERTDA